MESNFRFLIFIIILGFVCGEEYCYNTDSNPYLYHGTKTRYDTNSTKNLAVPSGCEFKYIFSVLRHGTRYPTESDKLAQNLLTELRDQIVYNHQSQRGKLCSQDLDALKYWTYVWDQSNYGKLSPQGRSDMEGLADRLKTALPDFSKNIAKDKLLFQTSSKDRCQDSALALSNSLLKTSSTTMDANNIKTRDDLLKPDKDDSTDKKASAEEIDKFIKSDSMTKVIATVSERCGYQTNLSFDQVSLMYKECIFRSANKLDEKAAFCVVFTKDDLKVLEYVDDLESYYESGYKSTTNKDIGCPVVRDMQSKFSEVEKNANPSQIGSFSFGHSSTLGPLYVLFKWYEDDESLKSDNYEKIKDYRKWRTSFISNFASQVDAVIFKCSGEHKVSFYHNERQVRLPGTDSELVPLKTVNEKLESITKECPAVTPSSGAASITGFLFVKEQLALFICIVFVLINKFVS